MTNKPHTQRLLDGTRKVNSDLKRANQAAGAIYDDRWIPSWQSSLVGKGSGEVMIAGDMPANSHYFEGFLFEKNEKEPFDWGIILEGLATPEPLQGRWTTVPAMEKAVRDYLSRRTKV